MVARRLYSSRPSSLTSRALSAIVSCCHVMATVRSKTISVLGEARMTFELHAYSCSVGSCSWAARRYDSSGRNITTKSGDESNCRQYPFADSFVTCSRTWRAWSAK